MKLNLFNLIVFILGIAAVSASRTSLIPVSSNNFISPCSISRQTVKRLDTVMPLSVMSIMLFKALF